MEKYVGRLVKCGGKIVEVVGYSEIDLGVGCLIADATLFGGWEQPGPLDVILKECESYWYASIKDLID